MEEKTNGLNETHSRKVKIAVLLIVVIGLLGGGWWWYQSMHYVSTDDARIGGTIVTISSKVTGRVTEVNAREGDEVQAGKIIIRLDAKDVTAQRNQAEAALAAAQAKLDEAVAGARPQEIEQARAAEQLARSDLDNVRRNRSRMEKLYHDGAISTSQWDTADNSYKVATENWRLNQQKLELLLAGTREETVRAALAQVKQAEAALEVAKVNYDNATLVAPIAGKVALKSVNPGEVVTAGQPLFSVVQVDDLWAEAKIEETKIGKVQVGQDVEYTVDAYPGQTFYGKVYEVGSAASSVFALIPTENSSGNFTKVTQRIPIKITLPKDTGLAFRPGMSIIVKIHVG